MSKSVSISRYLSQICSTSLCFLLLVACGSGNSTVGDPPTGENDPQNGQPPTPSTDTAGPTVSQTLFQGPDLVVLDAAKNRVLVGDLLLKSIFAVDLTTNNRTVFSDFKTPDENNPLKSIRDMVLDADHNRLLVGATYNDNSAIAIIAVDLKTGARSVFLDSAMAKELYSYSIRAMVLDDKNNRLIVSGNRNQIIAIDLTTKTLTAFASGTIPNDIDKMVIDLPNKRILATNYKQLVAIDLDTGSRTAVSNIDPTDATYSLVVDKGSNRLLFGDSHSLVSIGISIAALTELQTNSGDLVNNILFGDAGIAIDPSNGRALIANGRLNALYAIDLSDGARSYLSGSYVPNADNTFNRPAEFTIDSKNNRALVRDQGGKNILAVNLDTGTRTILTPSPGTGIVYDGTNNRIIGVNFDNINAINLQDNSVNLISGPSSSNDLFITYNSKTALDVKTNRLYAINGDSNGIIVVNLADGSRSVLSNSTKPNANNPFSLINDLVFDDTNNRLLVLDYDLVTLFEVAPNTGERKIVKIFGRESTLPGALAYDQTHSQYLITDDLVRTVFSIRENVTTVLADENTPNANFFLNSPIDIEFDKQHNRALVLDESWGGLISIDLSNGARSAVSIGIKSDK